MLRVELRTANASLLLSAVQFTGPFDYADPNAPGWPDPPQFPKVGDGYLVASDYSSWEHVARNIEIYMVDLGDAWYDGVIDSVAIVRVWACWDWTQFDPGDPAQLEIAIQYKGNWKVVDVPMSAGSFPATILKGHIRIERRCDVPDMDKFAFVTL